MTDLNGLVNVVTSVLPSVLALIRDAHSAVNPNDPPLTDAEVFAALEAAVDSSLATDAAWKAAHPPTG